MANMTASMTCAASADYPVQTAWVGLLNHIGLSEIATPQFGKQHLERLFDGANNVFKNGVTIMPLSLDVSDHPYSRLSLSAMVIVTWIIAALTWKARTPRVMK